MQGDRPTSTILIPPLPPPKKNPGTLLSSLVGAATVRLERGAPPLRHCTVSAGNLPTCASFARTSTLYCHLLENCPKHTERVRDVIGVLCTRGGSLPDANGFPPTCLT